MYLHICIRMLQHTWMQKPDTSVFLDWIQLMPFLSWCVCVSLRVLQNGFQLRSFRNVSLQPESIAETTIYFRFSWLLIFPSDMLDLSHPTWQQTWASFFALLLRNINGQSLKCRNDSKSEISCKEWKCHACATCFCLRPVNHQHSMHAHSSKCPYASWACYTIMDFSQTWCN